VRIGLFLGEASPPGSTIDDVIAEARWAEEHGLHTGWLPHVPWSLDALTGLALIGPHTSRIELGTAVVPTWSHHPLGMAQHALTTQAACGGRLLLGIGPSHQMVAEGWYGASYEGVIHHVRDYVGALEACFAAQAAFDRGEGAPGGIGGVVQHGGDRYPITSFLAVPGASPVPIYLAALAPLMLRLAGERAEGTITWMGDVRTHGEYLVPRLAAAAEAAGRPTPRVMAGLPIAVCDSEAEGRETAARRYGTYANIPTYARMLARGDAESPADVALVGPEAVIEAKLREYESVGVTDLVAMTFAAGADESTRADSRRRTRELLADLAGSATGGRQG
jgi:F420-dependent oxidoreductase-like protein